MAIPIVDPVLDLTGDGRITVEDQMGNRAGVITSAKFIRVEGLSMSVRAGGENHTQVTKAVREKLYDELGAPSGRHVLFSRQMVESLHIFKEWLTGRVFGFPLSSDTTDSTSSQDSEFKGNHQFSRKVGDVYTYRAGHRFLWNAKTVRNFSTGKRSSELHLDSEYFEGKSNEDYTRQKNALEKRQVELSQQLGATAPDGEDGKAQRESITRALNEVNRQLWLVSDILRRGTEVNRPDDINDFEALAMDSLVSREGKDARADVQEHRAFGDSYNYHEGDVSAFRYGDKKAVIKGTVKASVTGNVEKVQVGNALSTTSHGSYEVINGSANTIVNGIAYSEIGEVFASEKGGMFRELVYGHNLNYRFKDLSWQSYGDKVIYKFGPANSDTFGDTTSVAFVGSDALHYGDVFNYGTTSQTYTGASFAKKLALDLDLTAAAVAASVAKVGVNGLTVDTSDYIVSGVGTLLNATAGLSLHFGFVHYSELKKLLAGADPAGQSPGLGAPVPPSSSFPNLGTAMSPVV